MVSGVQQWCNDNNKKDIDEGGQREREREREREEVMVRKIYKMK